VLGNIPCEGKLCSDEQVTHQRRTFKKLESGAEPLDKIEDAKEATWIDVDEDVRLHASFSPVLFTNNGCRVLWIFWFNANHLEAARLGM
jgi:hypothetical protein